MAPFKGLLCLLVCLCLTGCGREGEPAAAPSPAPTAAPAATETPLPVFYAGEDGLVDMSGLCAALGFELSAVGEQQAYLEGRSLGYLPEEGVLCFDGRYIYAPQGFEIRDGRLWLEAGAAGKILGLDVTLGAVTPDISRAKLLAGGEDYYDLNCDMDMLYWLPQIIYAEAKEQPMAGLIGVGNVVMNRMESEKFPNSITGVIFDREHVIQFEPVENGSIKAQPDERSHIAACLCLEGYNTVDDSLFFVNPAYGSAWFDAELELSHTIGGHNFYRYK